MSPQNRRESAIASSRLNRGVHGYDAEVPGYPVNRYRVLGFFHRLFRNILESYQDIGRFALANSVSDPPVCQH